MQHHPNHSGLKNIISRSEKSRYLGWNSSRDYSRLRGLGSDGQLTVVSLNDEILKQVVVQVDVVDHSPIDHVHC